MNRFIELSIRNWLSIRILGRQFPSLTDYWDGNWLNVIISASDGRQSLTIDDACLRNDELARLDEELGALLRGDDTEAWLNPTEAWWDLRFERCASGEGLKLSVICTNGHCQRRGEGTARDIVGMIDTQDIQLFRRQIADVLKVFPIVGVQNAK